MRKLILIILFVLLVNFLYGNVIDLDYSVELGWVPLAAFGGYEQEPVGFYRYGHYYRSLEVKGYSFWNSFYTELSTKVWLYDVFYIGGGITVQIHYNKASFSFDPDFTNYNFEAGIKLGKVKLFCSHDCTHPQMTYNEFYRVTSLWGEGYINRFGLKISNK